MIRKLFKGPNKVRKIISATMGVVAIISALIWVVIEWINFEVKYSKGKMSAAGFNYGLANIVLMIVICVLGALALGLIICWTKAMMRRPGKTLKCMIVALVFSSLAILAGWLISEIFDIVATYNKFYPFRGSIDISIYAKALEAFAEQAVTILIYGLGIVVVAVILYGLIDGAGRIVFSLERIANHTGSDCKKCVEDYASVSTEELVESPGGSHASVRTGSE